MKKPKRWVCYGCGGFVPKGYFCPYCGFSETKSRQLAKKEIINYQLLDAQNKKRISK